MTPEQKKSFKSGLFFGVIFGGLFILFTWFSSPLSGGRYKDRAQESDAKYNLHHLYLGCKAFWEDNGGDKECEVATVSTQDYGFVQSDRVNIEGHGTESTFTATAQHMDSTAVFTIDAYANITKKK